MSQILFYMSIGDALEGVCV